MGLMENNRFSAHIMNTLNTMRQNGEFCDLVFELNNCKFSAHRLVMAAWSLPMKNLLQFQSTCTQHLRVVFDKPDVFHMLITFMYTGALPTQMTNISALLLLAATFQIPLLTELCEEQLKISTMVDNVIQIYFLSIKFQLADLEQHCVEFLCKHLKEITQRQELQDLTPAQINTLLGSEHMLKYGPEIKLSLITSWLAKDTSNKEQFLVLLLKHIEWSKMTNDFLKEIIQTENVFASNPSSLYLLLQTVNTSNVSLGSHKSYFQSLQQRYSYLLKSVCNSNDVLNPVKPMHFQPLTFSLVFPSTGDLSVPDRQKNSTNIVGIKNEPVQSVNFDKNEVNCDFACSDVNQNHVHADQDISLSVDNTSKCVGFGKSSSETSCSLEKGILLEGTHVASSQSTDVKSRIRKQLIKPHGIIRDSDATKSTAPKISVIKTKKSENRKQPRRWSLKTVMKDVKVLTSDGEGTEQKSLRTDGAMDGKDLSRKEQNVRERKMTTRQTSSKSARAANARNTKPGHANTQVKVSQVIEMRKKNSSKLLRSCSQCDYTTYNQLSLEKHHKQVHEGNCLFCCNLCSFKSKWSKEYYDHMKQNHFPGPPFHCDDEQCEYSTDKFQQLFSHRKQHSDQRPFVCDICLMAFRSKNNLYQHFKIHSDEKKFECPECGRSFKLKNTLEQHMVTHSDLRPYLCDLCGFCTKFQSHLISHKRIHTGDVYHCNFHSCAYSTPKQSQLKSHMRSHLGIRCHVCGSCGKAFIEKSHLIRHERTHSSERSHVCKECTYSSTRADKLREHVQKHHSEEALRNKTLPSVSKKLDASRKGKVISRRDRQYQDEAASGNVIEVVVIKNNAEHPVSANFVASDMAIANVLIDNDINVRMFHTQLSQQLGSSVSATQPVAPTGNTTVTQPVAPTGNTTVTDGFNLLFKNENELCGVEVNNIKETTFGCQVQSAMIEATGNLASMSSLENHAIMTCSSIEGESIEGDRAAVSEEMINPQQTVSTDVTVLSYSRTVPSSSDFSKPYTQCDQAELQHGMHGLLDFTTSANASSAEMQQYYHSQQHQNQEPHEDLQAQPDIEQSDFLNDENYLY